MQLAPEVLAVLRCPGGGSELAPDPAGDGLISTGGEERRFRVEDGFLTFAKPDVGKYDPDYARRYAALWAYGSETLHSGLDEPLYRTVSSLAAEALTALSQDSPVIVDAGCGVGRNATDAARLAPGGQVIALDGSLAMLELAQHVAHAQEAVRADLSAHGFEEPLRIAPRRADNVTLLRADVESLPIASLAADLALSVNIVDRLPHGPELALAECHRILKPGGRLLFTDPLNFTDSELWQRYGRAEQMLAFTEGLGFTIDVWFDSLPYREILDRRRSFEEFRTLVVAARRGT